MNYIFYIIIIASFLCLAFVPLFFRLKLRRDFFGKMAIRKILAQNPSFFASRIIWDLTTLAINHRRTDILEALVDGKLNVVIKLISKKNPLTAAILTGFTNPQIGIRKLKSLVKKTPLQQQSLPWLALLYNVIGQKAESAAAWDNVNEKKLSPYLKAHYKINLANTALRNGDLEFASQNLYLAATLFNHSKAFYEEAGVYLKLGTIYRVCFVHDTAETLFRSALKIFKLLQNEEGIAKTFANLGMLASGQERFDEASAFFNQAKEYCSTQKLPHETAYIQNQIALLHILQKDYKKAKKFSNQALKLHLANNNINGEAFSIELKADCYWGEHNFKSAERYAARAANLYKKSENISGMLESLYLQAQALLAQNKDISAEKILRRIIDIGKKDSGCFYLANAYNLLGIIYVKRQDLLRAKGLFRQSLNLEQRGVRVLALATDYANLGLVDFYCGHIDDAKKNLQTALKLADDAGDEELRQHLQQQLNRFNN